MPRIARVVVVDYPHHVTQRGNNRSPVFFDDEGRNYYLESLIHYSRKYRMEKFVILDNVKQDQFQYHTHNIFITAKRMLNEDEAEADAINLEDHPSAFRFRYE